MENCIFCQIANKKKDDFIVWENKNFIAFLDRTPANEGHLLLIPKKHIDYFFDLDDKLYNEIFQIAKKLAVPLQKVTNAKRIGIAVVGFDVSHAHLHLIPLHGSNELFSPDKFVRASPEELKNTQEKIIQELKKYNF